MLFGDSHADHWLPALKAVAESEGWRLHTLTHSGCDMVFAPQWWQNGGRYLDECDTWAEKALDRLGEISPNATLVVTSVTEDEYVDGTWTEPVKRFYEALVERGGAVMTMRSTPRPALDLPNCLSRAAWRGEGPEACAFPRRSPLRGCHRGASRRRRQHSRGSSAEHERGRVRNRDMPAGRRRRREVQGPEPLYGHVCCFARPALADSLRRSGFIVAPTAAAQRTPR